MSRDSVIVFKKFSEIDLDDVFFNSLKDDYQEFSDWFGRKADAEAMVTYDVTGDLQGFLYLKIEDGPVTDIVPSINYKKILKVGTFKIDAHNTKLGERFVKKIFDYAIVNEVESVYVTVFPQHTGLIKLFDKYGFKKYGTKTTDNGSEDVYIKNFNELTGDIYKDYPIIDASRQKWIIGVYDKYHTGLFPDSILNNEDASIVRDVSHTNSIDKVYVGNMMEMTEIKKGDVLCIYRIDQSAPKNQKRFKNVITSICIADEVLTYRDFESHKDFLEYVESRSVFDRNDLQYWIDRTNGNVCTIKITYNIALPKRINRDILLSVGFDNDVYWGLFKITDEQFKKILELGEVYEGVVIH